MNNAIIMITYMSQSSVYGTLPVSMVTLTYFLRHPHTELILCNCEANLSLVCLKISNMFTNINVTNQFDNLTENMPAIWSASRI